MRPGRREGARTYLPGLASLLFTGVWLWISSCAPIPPQTTTPAESIPPKIRDPQEQIQELSQRLQQFRSLRTLATVYYWGADGKGGFQEAILVQRPGRLRLETLSAFGAILVVTADGDEIVGFHPREALFYRGRSSKKNLLRYTQIPLELPEITALLMGLPPVDLQARWQGDGNSIHRNLGEGRREMIVLDPTLGIPTKWERSNAGGKIELTALFSDFSSTPAGLFPLKISLEAPAQQRRVEIRYQDPELNVDLPSSLFVQEKPANVREVPIESLGG